MTVLVVDALLEAAEDLETVFLDLLFEGLLLVAILALGMVKSMRFVNYFAQVKQVKEGLELAQIFLFTALMFIKKTC